MTDAARLILLELGAPPATPISAAGLSEVLAGTFTPRQVGAHLRELRAAGLALPQDARTGERLDRVPSGRRVLWSPA